MTLLEPADLLAWWMSVEAALLSLDTTFAMALKPNVFTKDHIAMFGPLVLGARGW